MVVQGALRIMMGTKVRRFEPLSNVSLETLVPKDHFYRHVERTLDLSFVRDLVRSCYAAGGRPSVDPVVYFKLQLIMFFEGIRSERQLIEVAADRLSVRWFLGYDLHEALPDHSSLTKIRDRYGVTIFRQFFERIVEQCQQEGLVWGKELYLDSTQVEANADKDKMLPRFSVDAMTEHLAALFPEAEPRSEAPPTDRPPHRLSGDVPARTENNTTPTHPARHNWITELGRPDRTVRGTYQRQSDIWINTTDPDATRMHKKGGGTAVGYHTHYVVDGGKARIILNVLVTPSEVMDNQPMQDLLWHTCFRWHLQPTFACGDTTYGTIDNIVALEDANIRAYMPLPDFTQRTPFYGKHRFSYEADADQYRCPNGAVLARWRIRPKAQGTLYRADAAICHACPLKAKCTESDEGRTVWRHFDEPYVDIVRQYHETEQYKKAMRKRAVWVEPLFGEGKAWHGMERFQLRQLVKVNIEAFVTATGQNLKRLLSWRGWGRRWLPGGAVSVVNPADLWSHSLVPA